MADQQWTDFSLEAENDDVRMVKKKLGLNSENVTLGDRIAYLNKCLDGKGNTILMRFVEKGKKEVVKCLLELDGLEVNAKNKDDNTAAEIARENDDYVCLLMLVEADSLFPKYFSTRSIDQSKSGGKELVEFMKRREELHECVKSYKYESDVMEVVKEVTKLQKSSFYFDPKNKSLLYRAAKERLLEVYCYLLFIGARYRDVEESWKHDFDGCQDELEVLLEEYFARDQESHVLKLKSSTRVLGSYSYTNRWKEMIEKLYNHLNRCKFVSLVMKVIAHQEVDFVFDFETECMERVCHWSRGENFGVTDMRIHKIYIGAKTCENFLDKNVAGMMAHEMCHLAMKVLYENIAKPYNAGKEEEFDAIVQEINVMKDGLHKVISRVFNYEEARWHSELIVRVPHILGIYDDIEGKKLLLKQVPKLYKYYDENIVHACEAYCKDAFFSKPICLIQSLHKYHGCIGVSERKSHPLKEPPKSFKNYLTLFGKISVIVTSNTKLCCLHVYHELKGEYKYQVEKQCLFFKLDTYRENQEQINNAFRCRACHYIVLVAKNEIMNFAEISGNICDIVGEDKTAILIIPDDCKPLNASLKWNKLLEYEWNDFSEDFKEILMEKKVNFKGKESELKDWIEEGNLSKIISPEDLLRLTDQEGFEIGDGKHLISHGYDKDYFIERTFVNVTAKKSIFTEITDSSAILVTGLQEEELEELGIDKGKIQLLGHLGEEIREGKCIFLPRQETESSAVFDTLFQSKDSVHWLHYLNGEFHWRISRGKDEMVNKHRDTKTFMEEELIYVSKDRVVLISDDAGTGKSTVISDLIGLIRNRYPNQWVGRIDLNLFAEPEENPISLANIKNGSEPDAIIEIFVKMLGLKTCLEVYLFRMIMQLSKEKYNIFVDGYDEICPNYKQNALKLLRTLKEKTTMQIWITTRRHERIDLEMELNTFSYNMESFTEVQQARFLDRFWKHNLKSQNLEDTELGKETAIKKIRVKIEEMERCIDGQDDSELRDSFNDVKGLIRNANPKETPHKKFIALKSAIDNVDFTKYATTVLATMRDTIDEEDSRFTGLPLHLYMLGIVAYHNNLRVTSYTNIRGLYSDFVKTKIDIYWKEKCRIEAATVGSDYEYDKNKRETMRHHREIAKCAVLFEKSEYIHDDRLMKSILDIGMIIKGERSFHFIHKTIADFFFSEWVAENMPTGLLKKELFEDVLIQPKFIVVRRFLNAMFQNKEENVALSDRLIRELDVKRVFEKFLTFKYQGDEDSFRYLTLWKEIIGHFARVCDVKVTSEFCYTISDFCSIIKEKFEVNIYLLLFRCLDDEILTKIFDANYEFITQVYFPWLSRTTVEAVPELLEAMKRVMQARCQGGQIIEQTLELLELLESFDNNIFHMSCTNIDAHIFCKVLEFTEGIVGRQLLGEHLTKRNLWGHTVLHCSAMAGAKNFIALFGGIRSVLEEYSYLRLLKELDEKGNCFLNMAVANCHPEEFKQILNYLRYNSSDDILKEILFERNNADENVLHFAVRNRDIESFVELLKLSQIYLEDDEEFKEFVTDIDEDGYTIFHHRAMCGHLLRDLKVLGDFMSPIEIGELIEKMEYFGRTCLHVSFTNCERTDIALDNMYFVKSCLADDRLEEFFLRSDKEGNTLLHSTPGVEGYSDHTAILSELEGTLSSLSFAELMGKCNKHGYVVKPVKRKGLTYLKCLKEGEVEEESD